MIGHCAKIPQNFRVWASKHFTFPKKIVNINKDNRKGVLKLKKDIKDFVIAIPDFPEPGIIFRDVTSVLQSAEGLKLAVDELQNLLEGLEFDAIAGIESRGFIFGTPLSYNLGKPFIPIRKKGKLPRKTVSVSYDLEYGTAEIEMNIDAVKPGDRIVLIDDLMATGGTLKAAAELVEKLGGKVVKTIALLELAGLEGRKLLEGYDVATVAVYEGK